MENIRPAITVGEYLLTPVPQFNLFEVSRPDGRQIPKELLGRWTSPHDFRHVHDAVVAKQKLRGHV